MTYKLKSATDAATQYGFLVKPVKIRIASAAAATDFEIVLFHAAPFVSDVGNGYDSLEYGRLTLYTVKKVLWVPDTAQAGATATKSTYTVKKYDSAGGNAATVATFDGVTGADLTAFVAKDFGAITNGTLKSGESLTLAKTHTSTGTATPAGLIVVDIV